MIYATDPYHCYGYTDTADIPEDRRYQAEV